MKKNWFFYKQKEMEECMWDITGKVQDGFV